MRQGSWKSGPVFFPHGTGSTTAVTGPPSSGWNSAHCGSGILRISAALMMHADSAAGPVKVGAQQTAGGYAGNRCLGNDEGPAADFLGTR
ncbi:MAG TPA: hypothetical protein DEQ49_00915 [Arthrobacter bacterium]|nr:hypothetical protein [Arthrobacter sp.]HCC38500.1 hypothetical protein [Arthrobacter sp.]